jgi:transposase
MRVIDRFSTAGGNSLQPLVVEIGPGRLAVPVERVEEADMRWDERRREVDPVWWSASGFSEEASQMPKTRPPYAPEFRRQMVELVRAGRDPAELAREFEPTAQSISHWVAQADRQEGRREEKGNGLSAAEREELARLRRENKQLRLERDILSRAAAWFARETGAIPPGSSNS